MYIVAGTMKNSMRFLKKIKNRTTMKWSEVKVTQSCPTLCNPMDGLVHGILQARILEWLPFPSPGDFPNPGIESRSLAWQADYLPAQPQGKSKNTGVGSLSLLQRIFPTQLLQLGSPAFQVNSLPTELSGKPRTIIWSRNSTSGYFSEEKKNTNSKV